jgi:hypothetical protein
MTMNFKNFSGAHITSCSFQLGIQIIPINQVYNWESLALVA